MAQEEITKEVKYRITGTHCASCELIVERKLLELSEIKAVAASRDQVVIEYAGKTPDRYRLNRLFSEQGYKFFDKAGETSKEKEPVNWLIVMLGLILAGLLYLLINRLGLISLVRVDASSSLPSFFIFGLLAGFSTCAALVGGIVLSLAKNWSQHNGSIKQKIKPHLLFNAGRIISFALLGAMLGAAGKLLSISPIISSIIIIIIAIYMIITALNMLGISYLRRLGLRAPRSITRYTASSGNNARPLIIGALTFILPCGFTLTTEGLALLSGSYLQGAAIMLAFVLGTLIPLLVIGIGSSALYENKTWSANFSRIAGIILLIFAIFNLNAGLNILGVKISLPHKTNDSATTESNIQIIKMTADSSGYSPNYFKVKAGIPVRWEIYDAGASGCTNVIISRNFFNDQIKLQRGKTSVKEFTPSKPGKYRFSCWMGMVSGTIEVTN